MWTPDTRGEASIRYNPVGCYFFTPEVAVRVTRKVFHDLAIWMIVFGLLIGLVFPFFVILLGVSARIALTPIFFLACLGAGALAGIVNYALARGVVGSRMRLLAHAMTHIEENLLDMAVSGDVTPCTAEDCLIPVDSEDEIGESAAAFNCLVEALAHSMETQAAVRSFSEMLTGTLELEDLARRALSQFMEHTGASGGAILCESAGELTLAASHGLLDADSLADNDHIRLAVRTGELQTVRIPDDVQVNGILAQFRPSEIAILPATHKSSARRRHSGVGNVLWI
jgi:two-component system, cell cycle response regulator